MRKRLLTLLAVVLCLMVAIPAVNAIWYVTADIMVGRARDDHYMTYNDTNGFPGAMMFSRVMQEDPWGGCMGCWRTTGWTILDIQDDNTWQLRHWSDSGQEAPTGDQCGCVKACVIVGFPPTFYCDVEGRPTF